MAIIEIKNGVARHPLHRMKNPLNLTILAGEQVAIMGNNGSGKSELTNTLTGAYPLLRGEVEYDFSPRLSNMACDNIRCITFRDNYGDTAEGNYYYQQRYNSQDAELYPTVEELMPHTDLSNELHRQVFDLFHLEEIWHKSSILLSSGEMRRMQLAKALMEKPRIVFIDNPFIGLDSHTRQMVQDLLEMLSVKTNMQFVLILSREDEIPPFITHVIPVEEMTCGSKITRDEYLRSRPALSSPLLSAEKSAIIRTMQGIDAYSLPEEVVTLNKISVRYGNRTILKELSWEVKKGECWALQGENGSGKSTLLSLICADNPQGYACDMALFGKKRGSGESIWEIKRNIGYVSPEMHRAYLKSMPAIDIVASGHHETVGLFKRPTPDERESSRKWMDIFDIAQLADTDFLHLSSGEQRLILLARAFVKDPALLILDEPMHGLDLRNRQLVKEIIDTFCTRPGKTLLLVTHYEEELPTCINKRMVLKKNY